MISCFHLLRQGIRYVIYKTHICIGCSSIGKVDLLHEVYDLLQAHFTCLVFLCSVGQCGIHAKYIYKSQAKKCNCARIFTPSIRPLIAVSILREGNVPIHAESCSSNKILMRSAYLLTATRISSDKSGKLKTLASPYDTQILVARELQA